MSKNVARLTRAEQQGHQHMLDELARRRGVLRWVCYASDAEPDPAHPGYWISPTYELLLRVPETLARQAMEAIGWQWDIEPEPNHDEEPN